MAKGTSRQIDIPVTDEDGNNFDMIDGKAVFWVGTSVCASGEDVKIMKDAPTITKNDITGLWTISVTILPADTENLRARASYYCECRVWDQFENEYVILAGLFEIDPSLTVTAVEP